MLTRSSYCIYAHLTHDAIDVTNLKNVDSDDDGDNDDDDDDDDDLIYYLENSKVGYVIYHTLASWDGLVIRLFK